MVEQENQLDAIFKSLSDPTRRDILQRLRTQNLSIGEVAEPYELSFAGVAKHIEVLAHAGLVKKAKAGKEQIVSIAPETLSAADTYLEAYRQLWERRLDQLGTHLQTTSRTKKHGTS